VHLDGYDLTNALAGKEPSPRKDFFYFNDDGSLVGLRYATFKEFPPSQKPGSFSIDAALEKLQQGGASR
jgi:arylsulfatase